MSDNQGGKNKRFKEIKEHFGLTQREMAEKTGLHQPKVSDILNEKAGTNILNSIFHRLNHEFGISEDWWEYGKGDMFVTKVPDDEESPSAEVLSEHVSPYESNDADYWRDQYIELQRKYTALLEGKLEKLMKGE